MSPLSTLRPKNEQLSILWSKSIPQFIWCVFVISSTLKWTNLLDWWDRDPTMAISSKSRELTSPILARVSGPSNLTDQSKRWDEIWPSSICTLQIKLSENLSYRSVNRMKLINFNNPRLIATQVHFRRKLQFHTAIESTYRCLKWLRYLMALLVECLYKVVVRINQV